MLGAHIYTYIYVYTYSLVYKHIHLNTLYIDSYIHIVHMYIYIYIYIHMTYTWNHTYSTCVINGVCTCTCMSMCVYIYIHNKCAHTYISLFICLVVCADCSCIRCVVTWPCLALFSLLFCACMSAFRALLFDFRTVHLQLVLCEASS